MIKALTVVNNLGDHMELDLANPYENGIAVTGIDGLGPGQADILLTDFASGDGAVFNSSRLPSRNIVLHLRLLDYPEIIEKTRQTVYKYFPIKKPIWLIFETDLRRVQIQGYVESNEPEIFSSVETLQISIICPSPYFQSLDDEITDFSGVTPEFEFDAYRGECHTAGANKVVNITNEATYESGPDVPEFLVGRRYTTGPMFHLETGVYIAVKFDYTDSSDPSTLTLQVNDTPAKPIRKPDGTPITTTLTADVYWLFYYDGTNYTLLTPSTSEMASVFSYGPVHIGVIYMFQEKTLTYLGEVDTGFEIDIVLEGDVGIIHIYNVVTLEEMVIDPSKIISKYNLEEIHPGDRIIITTSKGNKKATFIRGFNRYNIINAFDKDIDWFQLRAGDNIFAYTVTSGITNLIMYFNNRVLYEGV